MPDRAPQGHRVEPAAAPPTTCDRAEFVPDARQMLAVFVEQLGRERARTDPRRISLADAEHVIEYARPDARAGGSSARGGIGRGHEGIGTHIDIEHCALG